MLQAAHHYLSQTEGLEFLNEEVPLIKRRPAQFLNAAADLAVAIEQLEANPSAGLAAVEAALEAAFGLAANALSSHFNQPPTVDMMPC